MIINIEVPCDKPKNDLRLGLVDLILADILPERLKTKEILAVAAALDKQLKQITGEINSAIIIPRINEMPEEIVDSLAWQFHVDFYEPLGLNLELKRKLVKNSLDWHRRKGTKSVVEEIVQTLFFPKFKVEEWFEYGGRPYFFRCIINSQPVGRKELAEVINAIEATKNERSWIDNFVFKQEFKSDMFISGMVEDDITELFAMIDQPEAIDTNLYISAVLEDFVIENILLDEDPPIKINSTLYMAVELDELQIELFDTKKPQTQLISVVYISCAISEHITELFTMDLLLEITTQAYIEEITEEVF